MNDRIIKALSGFYYVQTPDGVVECRARGRFRKEGVSPLVGDFVRISRSGKSGTVEEILPRKNSFIRPAVANVDLLVLLASCAIPQTEPFLIDRVLAIAGQQGVEPLICVNKNDLEPGASLAGIYERAGFRVIVTSAETGEGMDELHAAISGKLSAFTGNSGVGKSSILNKLCPELHLLSARSRKRSEEGGTPRGTSSCTHWETIPLLPTRPAFPRSTRSGWIWS